MILSVIKFNMNDIQSIFRPEVISHQIIYLGSVFVFALLAGMTGDSAD